MKRLFSIILILLCAIGSIQAQQLDLSPEEKSPLRKVYEGKYHFIDKETGDTLLMLVLYPIIVMPHEKFANSKQEQFYWRTVRDVKKTLPYAKLICSTLLETYEYIETFPTKEEKEKYLKEFEGAIYEQYKPVVKSMTKNQGKILLKLINRETNQSSFNIVKAFLGSFRAGFWHTFGKLFGMNMKMDYKPESNKEDAMIERICIRVEQGTL